MNKPEREEIIRTLLASLEEEDIGISLIDTYSANAEELAFFKEYDRERVLKILNKLSEDSKRHKEILKKLIEGLGEERHEN